MIIIAVVAVVLFLGVEGRGAINNKVRSSFFFVEEGENDKGWHYLFLKHIAINKTKYL